MLKRRILGKFVRARIYYQARFSKFRFLNTFVQIVGSFINEFFILHTLNHSTSHTRRM